MRSVPGNGQLFLGPGARLAALRPILAAVAGPGRTVRQLEALDALAVSDVAEALGAGATLVLDADLVETEDLGWLRRFLAPRPACRLVLVGDDPGRRGARALLRAARARWTSWPPDVLDLEEIAGSAADARDPAPPAPGPADAPVVPPRAPEPPVRRTSLEEELARIEAILEMPAASERISPGLAPEISGERFGERADAAPAGRSRATESAPPAARPSAPRAEVPATERLAHVHAVPPAATAVARPPRYFRDQVADLADIAQRLELGLDALESTVAEEGADEGAVDELRGEVARLVQFTRTLGYLVAPPPPGEQVFDLGETIRVIVAGLVARGPDSPRCLMRGNGALLVRSDRALLGQAFDAFFFLVQFAAQSGEVVRVQWSSEETAPDTARISVEFPAGPLKDLPPAQIVEPYALRRMLPELGANALSAAIGIVQGQGGEAALRRTPAGRLEWQVTLPRHADAGQNGSPAVEAARADDPFA